MEAASVPPGSCAAAVANYLEDSISSKYGPGKQPFAAARADEKVTPVTSIFRMPTAGSADPTCAAHQLTARKGVFYPIQPILRAAADDRLRCSSGRFELD